MRCGSSNLSASPAQTLKITALEIGTEEKNSTVYPQIWTEMNTHNIVAALLPVQANIRLSFGLWFLQKGV